MDTHPGYCNNVFTRWRLFSCSVLLATMNLKTREKPSRGIGTVVVIILSFTFFGHFFRPCHSCKYASHPLLMLSCSWFSYSQLSLKVLMRNWHFQCVQCFQCFQRQVEITSLISKGKTQSQVIITCSISIPEQKKTKQIVPISIFLKISFISQHPTQGGVGQLASWKGERDWGWYPASEKWLFAFLARIFFPWE